MDTKLTLTVDQNIIAKAKSYAKLHGRSLSDIIENYLKILINENPPAENEISPFVKSMKGTFNAPRDFDYDTELAKSLAKKHL